MKLDGRIEIYFMIDQQKRHFMQLKYLILFLIQIQGSQPFTIKGRDFSQSIKSLYLLMLL